MRPGEEQFHGRLCVHLHHVSSLLACDRDIDVGKRVDKAGYVNGIVLFEQAAWGFGLSASQVGCPAV